LLIASTHLPGLALRVFALGVVVWIGFTILAFLVANRMIFLPPPPSYSAETLPVVQVPTPSGGSVAVLHLPAGTGQLTFLYSHGNAEDLGHLAPFLERLHAQGFGVIAYDYRGYGESGPGPPTVRKSLEDAEVVYQYAVGLEDISPERLVLYGTSVGSGPAVDLAARHRVAGVILQSPFMSAYTVMTRIPLLPFDPYPNLRRMREVRSPVLVIHGTEDSVVPWFHGRRIYEAAPEPREAYWVDGAGHNDLLIVAGNDYFEVLDAFAEQVEEWGS